MTDPKTDMLDDLFAQARELTPTPSDDLFARVLAGAVIPPAATVVARPHGIGAKFLGLLGGWPAVGGLAAATFAGVWVGVAPPAAVEDYTAALWGDEITVSIFADTTVYAGDL